MKLNHFETQVKNIILIWRDFTDTNVFDVEEVLEVFNEYSFYQNKELPWDKTLDALNVLNGTIIKKIGACIFEIKRS